MRHDRELRLEKDTEKELIGVINDVSKLKIENWILSKEHNQKFVSQNSIPETHVLTYLTPYYTHVISESEKKVFRGILHFGILENSLTVFDIIELNEQEKLPVHMYNFVLDQFLKDVISKNIEIFKNYIGTIKLKKDKPQIIKKTEVRHEKKSLVISANADRYEVFNYRIKKPMHYFDPSGKGEMLLQETNELNVNKKEKINFFTPNNIAILLSISLKAKEEARQLLKGINKNLEVDNPIELIKGKTALICDYIEKIQTSIVFSYTTLEAFVNLSIPEDYEYFKIASESGVAYEKKYVRDSIERLLPLKEKLKDVLPDIYETKSIENETFYGRFSTLETLRNKIIHQKSIEYTDLYDDYFKESIFKICGVAEEIIDFFYENCKYNFSTNPIWPWIKGKEKILPKAHYKPDFFEKRGTIYDKK